MLKLVPSILLLASGTEAFAPLSTTRSIHIHTRLHESTDDIQDVEVLTTADEETAITTRAK